MDDAATLDALFPAALHEEAQGATGVLRIQVPAEMLQDAAAALDELERAHAAQLAVNRLQRRRGPRRATATTLVEAAPTMADLNAEAWRRTVTGAGT